MIGKKKKEAEPIVFEVQKMYNRHIHTIKTLKLWTERNDALVNSGQRTVAEWEAERRYLNERISALEEELNVSQEDVGGV